MRGIQRRAVKIMRGRSRAEESAPIIKKVEEIAAMREAAALTVGALLAVREAIRPGVTTGELDRIAYEYITQRGGIPTFIGYPPGSRHPFPATLTVSVNEELVHGIPGSRRLEEGDIVSVDCGVTYKGFVGDAAYTVGVGKISREAQRLLEVTERALYKGIEACVPGKHFGDVSHAIQAYVEGEGYNVVRYYGGHGVGRQMHEPPHIPNYGRPGTGHKLMPGMTFALEPMVMTGSPETRVLNDNWTVVAADGKLCAHFEHTVLVTEGGPEILTKME